MQFAFDSNSSQLITAIVVTALIGFLFMFGLTQAPVQVRRPLIMFVTFICGLFYVLLWLWPAAQDHSPGDIPQNGVESMSFWLQDSVGDVGAMATVLTSFLLGLGAISLWRIHLTRLIKRQKDAFFSFVTLAAMVGMIIVGYMSWHAEKFSSAATSGELDFNSRAAWAPFPVMMLRDFMFDGILQKMDAAMFSIIAFYIISAAYRAFRIRSVESTILLCAALVMMLSLLPMAEGFSSDLINNATNGDKNHVLENFKLTEIAGFVRNAFQSPSIRGIDFGIGIGALAMGLRLWLSLDKQALGGSN